MADESSKGAPGGGGEARSAGTENPVADGDTCRCEDVSKMTPRQLLSLMLGDLAFWKNPAREKTDK